jgi:cytochrome P450
MIHNWTTKAYVTTVAKDTRTITLHVLLKAIFGKSYGFQTNEEDTFSSELNYRDALRGVLDDLMIIAAFGRKLLANTWLPRVFKRAHYSCEAFQNHMTEAYQDEKTSMEGGYASQGTFMASLIRASQEEAKIGKHKIAETAIYGNIFLFSFAGHDSTTHALTFALIHLAAAPDVQDWISKEINHVFGDQVMTEWDYTTGFPRLQRCVAVFMETVRLYSPLPIAKWTADQPVQLRVKDKVITIPKETRILLNYAALHTHPKFWGDDAAAWRPSRWIQGTCVGQEEIVRPQRGSFIAWSEGQRACPGKKFSQVEFAATLATLFRDWKVEPRLKSGETKEAARQRVLDFIEADTTIVLLLQMVHPEHVPLVWTRR